MPESSSRFVAVVVILGDLLAAIVKLAAGVISGSSAVFAGAMHSIVDVVHQLAMYAGLRPKPADASVHPLSFGKSRFFWAYTTSMLVLGFGSVIPITGGISQLLRPAPLIETSILYVVMLSVLSFQLVSMTVSLAEFGHRHKGLRGWLSHIQSSRNFTLSWLWKEEILNLLGIAIVLAGVMLTDMTGDARYDGAASLLIGILLLVLAFALARDVRHLLIGETLSPQVHGQVTDLLEEHAAVREIIALEAVYLRPDHVLLSLVLDYDPEARAELIALLQRAVPELHQIDIAAKRG